MKHRIIGAAGIAISILLALWESLEVLYNYGTSGLGLYHQYYCAYEFQWGRIECEDWIGFTLAAFWYFFLIVPWVQYFWRGLRKKSFGVTLMGNTDFSSVFFTVFNVSMIISSALILFHPHDSDYYWLYELVFFVVLMSAVYVPWAIIVVAKNIKLSRVVESEDMQQKQISVKPAYWLVSLIPFILLAAFVVWLSWTDDRYADLHEGRTCGCVNGKWGYVDRKGDVAIPVIYDDAGNFKNGKAEVRLDTDRFYIDVNGRRLNN